MASFRRIIDSGVKTTGEQVAPQSSVLGDLANVAAQGFAIKKQMDKDQAKKDKEEFVSLRTDELLDKAKSFQDQKNWSSYKVNKWLEDQLRKEDPHVQDELMKNVANQRALGGLTLTKTAQDFAIEQDQMRVQQGVALLQSRGIPIEDITDEAARDIFRQQEILQQESQAQKKAEQEAIEMAEVDSKKALDAIGRYQSKTGIIVNSTKASLLESLKGMKDHDSALNLVDTYLGNARTVKAQIEASYDQMLSGLSGDDRKEAVEMKKKAMEDFNASLEEVSALQDIPADKLQRTIDIKQLEFKADHDVIIKLDSIQGAYDMMGYDLQKQVSDIYESAINSPMPPERKQRLTDALGDKELTHGELQSIFEGEDDVVIGEVALQLHKPYLEAVIGGSKGAIEPAKASFLSLMDVVDRDSSQASSILPLALQARPHLYQSMNDEEKGLFDFTLTDSIRGTVGDSQTGLLAGLPKREIFEFSGGKLTVKQSERERLLELAESPRGDFARGPSLGASQARTSLNKFEKVARDINTFISEASTLDSPALKNMSPEQKMSYLTSLETGNSLSDFSNIPPVNMNPKNVQEAIANNKTVEEVEEEASLAEQRRSLGLATQMMMSVDVNDPQNMANTASRMEQEFRGKIPDSQLNMLLTGLTGVVNQEVAQQTADANIQRAGQAENVEGRPSSQKATRDVPKEVAEDKEFLSETTSVAQRTGAKEEDLLRIIDFETGGTFDPAQKNNAGGSAIGLIQFMPEVAEEMGTTSEELSKMTRAGQMKVVGDYLEKRLKGIENPTLSDLYMAVLRPASVGKPENSTVYKKGSKAYEANKGLDTNNDGKITKAEATQKVLDNTAMTDLKSLLQEANTPEERNQVLIDANIVSPD